MMTIYELLVERAMLGRSITLERLESYCPTERHFARALAQADWLGVPVSGRARDILMQSGENNAVPSEKQAITAVLQRMYASNIR